MSAPPFWEARLYRLRRAFLLRHLTSPVTNPLALPWMLEGNSSFQRF